MVNVIDLVVRDRDARGCATVELEIDTPAYVVHQIIGDLPVGGLAMIPNAGTAAPARYPRGSNVHINDGKPLHRQVIAAVGLNPVAVSMICARSAGTRRPGIPGCRCFDYALCCSAGAAIPVDHDPAVVAGVDGAA